MGVIVLAACGQPMRTARETIAMSEKHSELPATAATAAAACHYFCLLLLPSPSPFLPHSSPCPPPAPPSSTFLPLPPPVIPYY